MRAGDGQRLASRTPAEQASGSQSHLVLSDPSPDSPEAIAEVRLTSTSTSRVHHEAAARYETIRDDTIRFETRRLRTTVLQSGVQRETRREETLAAAAACVWRGAARRLTSNRGGSQLCSALPPLQSTSLHSTPLARAFHCIALQ